MLRGEYGRIMKRKEKERERKKGWNKEEGRKITKRVHVRGIFCVFTSGEQKKNKKEIFKLLVKHKVLKGKYALCVSKISSHVCVGKFIKAKFIKP